jgi:hypothetical protein
LNTFHIYQKSGIGKEITNIADLIPVGRENAISRKSLVSLCIAHGLIDDSVHDKDRAMRLLLKKARLDYVILNLSNGRGYYRVSREDMQDLQRYIRQEDKRAKSSFKNITMAKALYEDFVHGRVAGDS